MSFAPPAVTCDVGFMLKDGTTIWVARGVDAFEAADYAFSPDRPEGSRFICKVLRR